MAKEQPHMESASQPTSFLLARSCSITSSLPAANVMHPSAALCAGPSCSSVASGRTPIWAAVTPACAAQGRVVTHSRFGEGSQHALGLVLAVGVTSMYSVITGRRVNLLSLGPSLYSVTRSTASATYDSGARNSSGCSCGVIGVDAAVAASGCRGAIERVRLVAGSGCSSLVQVTYLVATRCKITEEHRTTLACYLRKYEKQLEDVFFCRFRDVHPSSCSSASPASHHAVIFEHRPLVDL
eukprot:scaffold125943_cov60-Phaeocystis_antarctica.AAC.1